MNVAQVKQIVAASVEKDFCFYSRSGGGLTLSGGEPFSQAEFATELLKTAKSAGFDTAVETCGQVKWEILKEALPYINALMFDIKCIDPVKHKDFTGVSSKLILRISERFAPVSLKCPKSSEPRSFPGLMTALKI